MTTLIVTLPTDPTDPNALWDYLLSPDGRVAGEYASVSLGQLPSRKASGDQVVALVPAARLSWHAVQLPAGSLSQRLFQDRAAPRLRAILEGLLEDHLLDDPAQLHFALEPQAHNDSPVWVAVCDRTWLRAALQALAQSGAHLEQLRQRSSLQVRLHDLPERERDVMDLVVAGLPNKLIADQLDISVRTVEVHRARVFDKMQVKSAVELANLLRTGP